MNFKCLTLYIKLINLLKSTGFISFLFNEADELKEIQDGGSKMADTKMANLSLI